MSYYLSNPANGTQTSPILISEAELQAYLNLSANNNTAYWGFTSANGKLKGTTRFVFTETPVENDAPVKNQLYNPSKSEISVDRNTAMTDKYLTSGETLTINSTFDLVSSERDYTISSWQGKINPGIFVIPTTGQLAVTYAINGGTEIPATATIDSQGNISLNGINLYVPKTGGSLSVKLTLPTATGLTTQKTGFYSSISGRYGTDTADTAIQSDISYFWIKKGNNAPIVDEIIFDKSSYSDYIDTLSFRWAYHDDDATENELQMSLAINGQTIQTATLVDAKGQDVPWTQTTAIDLLAEDNYFLRGENTLEVTLTDAHGAIGSREMKFEIEGYKGFEAITDDYSWQYSLTELPTKPEPQNRQQSMIIKARDTTAPISTSRVTVSASQIASDKSSLPATNFVFKENDAILNLNAVSLEMNQEYDFAASEGLLLNLSDQDSVGSYQGTITWTIMDAP